MKKLSDIYKRCFFSAKAKRREPFNLMAQAIKDTYPAAKNFIDVGCGSGLLLWSISDLGLEVAGIEGCENAKRYVKDDLLDKIFFFDLRYPLPSFAPYDVAICLEVAEHIEEEHVDVFIDNLCGLSDRLLMSIAGPGQAGTYHVNLQEKPYWKKLFLQRGFVENGMVTENIKRMLEGSLRNKTIRCYHNNLIAFERGF